MQYIFYGFCLLMVFHSLENNLFNETIVTSYLSVLKYPEHGFIYCFLFLTIFLTNHIFNSYLNPLINTTLYDKFIININKGFNFQDIIEKITPKIEFQNPLIEITEKAKNFFTKMSYN